MYIAEKSIHVEIVALDLHTDNRAPEFLKKNPMGNLPVLELDDGTCISESMAICRYLEELTPEPRLFGESPLEVANVEMWNRRAELAFYLPIEFAGGFLGEDVARGARQRVERTMRLFDAELASRDFIVGETLTVADITTKVAIDFGVCFNGITIPGDVENFRRWNAEMDSRPSARA